MVFLMDKHQHNSPRNPEPSTKKKQGRPRKQDTELRRYWRHQKQKKRASAKLMESEKKV